MLVVEPPESGSLIAQFGSYFKKALIPFFLRIESLPSIKIT
jgi:hypothetical protein